MGKGDGYLWVIVVYFTSWYIERFDPKFSFTIFLVRELVGK